MIRLPSRVRSQIQTRRSAHGRFNWRQSRGLRRSRFWRNMPISLGLTPRLWSVCTSRRRCSGCRLQSVGIHSPPWSAMARMSMTPTYRSCTGMPPSRWLCSTPRGPLDWQPNRRFRASRNTWHAGSPPSARPNHSRSWSASWVEPATHAAPRDPGRHRGSPPRSPPGGHALDLARCVQASRH